MGWGDRQQVQQLRGIVAALRELPRLTGSAVYIEWSASYTRQDTWVRWSDIERLIRDVPAAPPRGLDTPGEK